MLPTGSSQSHRFCIGIMCWNTARKDTTAHRKRLAKSEAAYAQRRIPHSKRLGRRSICGAVLMPMYMPMLELASSAKAPNPEEAQHATARRGNVLEPCLRKCYGRAVTKALCLLKSGQCCDTAPNPARQTIWKARLLHCSPVQIPLLMSRGFIPAARNLTNSVLE